MLHTANNRSKCGSIIPKHPLQSFPNSYAIKNNPQFKVYFVPGSATILDCAKAALAAARVYGARRSTRRTTSSVEFRHSGACQPKAAANFSVDNRELAGRLAFVG
jgi:hypothetical protein